MKKISEERLGELMVFGETAIYAIFPIMVSYVSKQMPPILFVAIATIIAGIGSFLYLLFTKQLSSLKNKKALKYILAVTVFIIVIPSIFIFKGGSLTSGINTSILLQSEIVFTFLIYSLIKYEKITLIKILGAIQVIIGTIIIIYNGELGINLGDILIIAGTLFYPIGNIFAKKALKETTIPVIICVRSFSGGTVLLLISLFFESYSASDALGYFQNYYLYMLISGILIYWISKALWYGGLRRMDISKAILISVGGYPSLSLLFAIIFLHEIPTIHQWIGFVIICIGVFAIIKTQKSNQQIQPQLEKNI